MRMTVAASPHIRGDFGSAAGMACRRLEIWHSCINCYADMHCLFFGGRILILCFYKIKKYGY